MNNKFKPTHISYDERVERIKKALSKVGDKLDSMIQTGISIAYRV